MKLGTSPLLKLLTLAVVMSPLVSKADLITTLGNNPQPNEQLVLFNTTQSGSTVLGITNSSHNPVSFSSTTDMLGADANGQAVLTSAVAGNLLNQLTISAPGSTFKDIILNPQIPGPNSGLHGPWDLIITLNTNTGTYTYSFPTSGKDALSNGNNFVTFVATDGTVINSVDLTSTSGFDSLSQVRLSGLATAPEPASILLFSVGLTALAFGLRRYGKQVN